jgi:hypothetical protein
MTRVKSCIGTTVTAPGTLMLTIRCSITGG